MPKYPLLFSLPCLFKNVYSILTYATPWARATKNVKKPQGRTSRKKNVTWAPNEFFEFLNVRPFSPGHPLCRIQYG